MRNAFVWLFALACLGASVSACRTLETSAANDPRKCELDPKCARKPGNNNDCATACADNIQCMDRCHSVTGQ